MTVDGAGPGDLARSDLPEEPTVAELFVLLWDALADVLGAATTAVLLRRAASQAISHQAGLDRLKIKRERLTYTYALPDTWRDARDGDELDTLCAVVAELLPLLSELTGPVVIRRLQRLRALRVLGFTPSGEVLS